MSRDYCRKLQVSGGSEDDKSLIVLADLHDDLTPGPKPSLSIDNVNHIMKLPLKVLFSIPPSVK